MDLPNLPPITLHDAERLWYDAPLSAELLPVKVLVVEDDPDYRAFLKSAISIWGYAVTTCATGEEALELATSLCPDLILLDVGLPGKSGVEVVQIIKSDPDKYSFIPVLLHSGSSTSPAIVAGFQAGADDYITKPINFQELEVRLHSMLRFKKMHALLLKREGELETLNIRLEAESITDVLTSLYNRRACERTLERELDSSRRAARPMSLIVVDLDCFKGVNDKYGHPSGDEVLKQVAEILLHETRASDTVARWGGDEFALLLPSTTPEAARRVAERIREHAEHREFTIPTGGTYLTLSIGISSHPESGISSAELIDSADKALYKSKSAGRNRVTLA